MIIGWFSFIPKCKKLLNCLNKQFDAIEPYEVPVDMVNFMFLHNLYIKRRMVL